MYDVYTIQKQQKAVIHRRYVGKYRSEREKEQTT